MAITVRLDGRDGLEQVRGLVEGNAEYALASLPG
jgi:hypothetical protein